MGTRVQVFVCLQGDVQNAAAAAGESLREPVRGRGRPRARRAPHLLPARHLQTVGRVSTALDPPVNWVLLCALLLQFAAVSLWLQCATRCVHHRSVQCIHENTSCRPQLPEFSFERAKSFLCFEATLN